MWTGQFLSDDEAVAAGLEDEVVPPESLAAAALDAAQALAVIPEEVAAMTKDYLWAPVLDRVAERRAVDETVRQYWAAPETAARVAAYLEATSRR